MRMSSGYSSKGWQAGLFCLSFYVLTAAVPGFSAPGDTASGQTTGQVGPVDTYFGQVEVKPGWAPDSDLLDSRNGLEAGYRWSANQSIKYHQDINTTFSNPGTAGNDFDVYFPEAYFMFGWSNLWEGAGNWALHFEPRAHLPTLTAMRDAGMITELRPQFNLVKTFDDQSSFTVAWIPILHVYSRAGEGSVANPIVENRFEFIPKYRLTSQLEFAFPLKFYQKRFQGFQGASGFNAYTFALKPELLYTINSQYVVGAAYETGNLVQADNHAFQMGDGFRAGIAQLIFKANL